MANLDEAIAALQAEITDDDPKKVEGKIKAVGQRLYKDVKGVARFLIARGAGRKGAELTELHKDELAEKDQRIQELTEEKEAAEAEAEAAKGKAPDTQKAIDDLKAKHKKDLEAKDAKIAELTTSIAQKDVDQAVSRFKSRLGKLIDEDLVEGKVAEFRSRFRPGKNGTPYEVLAIGKDDEVLEPGEGEDEAPEAQLAEAVAQTVKPKFRLGSGSPGGGSGSGGQGGGNGGKPSTPEANVRKLRGTGAY
jgi:hypothetical protein